MFQLLALLSASVGAINCDAGASQFEQPLETQIDQVSAKDLSSGAKPLKPVRAYQKARYKVGRLIYQGNGYQYRSDDIRFPQVADSVVNLSSICQYQVIIPSGYDAATGKSLKIGKITFDRLAEPAQPSPGISAADRLGTRPVLDGYYVCASWPIYVEKGQMFFGLMRPENDQSPPITAIVVFAAKPGPVPAKLVGKLNGNYSSIALLPNIHGPGTALWVAGRDNDGSLKEVSLWMDGQTEHDLATRFATPKR